MTTPTSDQADSHMITLLLLEPEEEGAICRSCYQNERRFTGPCADCGRHGAYRWLTAEVLADLPKIPDQPEPHDVGRQGRPHPGEATLKMLNDPIDVTFDDAGVPGQHETGGDGGKVPFEAIDEGVEAGKVVGPTAAIHCGSWSP